MYDGKVARLEILEVFPEDEGEYTCVAQTVAGQVKTACWLTVQGEVFWGGVGGGGSECDRTGVNSLLAHCPR